MDALENFPLKEETYQIIKHAMTVYNTLGYGFLEAVYHEALRAELTEDNIPHTAEQPIQIYYKQKPLTKKYYADIIVDNKIILELKATDRLTSADEKQLLHYLKATGIEIGLLINFGNKRKLEWQRLIFTDKKYRKGIEDIPSQ